MAFDKILAGVADWLKVLIGVTSNCIVFTRKAGFHIIRPIKKWLDRKFCSTVAHPEKLVTKNVAAGRKFANPILVDSREDLRSGLFQYIRESYALP